MHCRSATIEVRVNGVAVSVTLSEGIYWHKGVGPVLQGVLEQPAPLLQVDPVLSGAVQRGLFEAARNDPERALLAEEAEDCSLASAGEVLVEQAEEDAEEGRCLEGAGEAPREVGELRQQRARRPTNAEDAVPARSQPQFKRTPPTVNRLVENINAWLIVCCSAISFDSTV